MLGLYDDHGIRFEHPAGWEIEVAEDEDRTTIAVQSTSGPAFILLTLDEDRPSASEMAEEALSAMREEYPGVEVRPADELIGGHRAVGFDLEFFSLDLVSECTIRAFLMPKRTVLVLAQWSTDDSEDDEEPGAIARALMASLEETVD